MLALPGRLRGPDLWLMEGYLHRAVAQAHQTIQQARTVRVELHRQVAALTSCLGTLYFSSSTLSNDQNRSFFMCLSSPCRLKNS